MNTEKHLTTYYVFRNHLDALHEIDLGNDIHTNVYRGEAPSKEFVTLYRSPLEPERSLELKVNGDGAFCGMGVKVDWPTFHLIDCGWNATEVRNLTRAVSPDLLTAWVSYCAESRDPQVWMVAQGVATPLLGDDGVWVFMLNRVGRDIANERS